MHTELAKYAIRMLRGLATVIILGKTFRQFTILS